MSMFSSMGRTIKKAAGAVAGAARGATQGQSCAGNSATQDTMRGNPNIILASGKTKPPITRPRPIDSGSTTTTQIGYPGAGQCGPSVQPAIYRPPAQPQASQPIWA